ncbi:MAG: hypothetical protein NVSMB33_00760 [Ktedonobacteraceae bacterium]
MNRDRQSNRNARKPYNPHANRDRQTIHDSQTTPVLRPSKSKRPTPAPLPPQEPGDKNPFVIGILIVLILFLLGTTGLYAWYLYKPGSTNNQTLSPARTPSIATSVRSTIAPCPDPTKQKNIFVKQIPENHALEVYIPQGTTSVVALFSSQQDLKCWTAQYNYNQLLNFAVYPKDGKASLVINEEDSSKQNYRPQGSWALVIIKGANALVTVVSLAQAHTDAQAWIGSHCIEQANYALTKFHDAAPA